MITDILLRDQYLMKNNMNPFSKLQYQINTSEDQNLLENHFGLQETFKRIMNRSSQWEFRNLCSSPKPVVKMKLNNLFIAPIIISINRRSGRVVKLKFIRYQLVVDILMKRNFVNHKIILSDSKISTRLQVQGK